MEIFQNDLVKLVGACVLAYAFIYGFCPGVGRFLHWYAHKTRCRLGKQELWRRKTDNVQMTGWRCHICGKLTCIEPVRISYKRMLRGEKYY